MLLDVQSRRLLAMSFFSGCLLQLHLAHHCRHVMIWADEAGCLHLDSLAVVSLRKLLGFRDWGARCCQLSVRLTKS